MYVAVFHYKNAIIQGFVWLIQIMIMKKGKSREIFTIIICLKFKKS